MPFPSHIVGAMYSRVTFFQYGHTIFAKQKSGQFPELFNILPFLFEVSYFGYFTL